MYSQLFGSFLLRKNAVTPEQLQAALSRIETSHIKLGTLAIHKGLMVASEVDQICFLQTREDKRFGELAVEKGFLTDEQVGDLLKSQIPQYLLIGQNLVDDGAITNADFETLMVDYQTENEIYDMDMNLENKDKISKLIERFFHVAEVPVTEYNVMYMELMFNNLIRFIGDDFTPLTPIPCTEFPINYCVAQELQGQVSCISRIDMAPEVAISFASRYAKEHFTEFDEYVKASLEDFLNLHNGLFSVNMSNEYSIELNLLPPTVMDVDVLELDEASFVIPIIYPFGSIQLIASLYTSV